MDLQHFKNPKYVRHINPGEIVGIGSFKPNEKAKLVSISLLFYKHGALDLNTTFAVEIYSTKQRDNLLWKSNELAVGKLLNHTENWLGWLKFDLKKHPISRYFAYYVFLKQVNYTHSDDSFIAVVYDFHDSQYPNGKMKFYNHAYSFKIEGEVEIDAE